MKKLVVSFQIIIILILSILFSQSAFAFGKKPSNVLVIYSQDFNFKWVQQLQKDIRSSLKAEDICFFHEYLNENTVSDKLSIENSGNVIQTKYKNMKFDCVIVADNYEYNFMADYYQKLAFTTPIIFVGTTEYAKNLAFVDLLKYIPQNKDMDKMLEAILATDNKNALIFVSSPNVVGNNEISAVQKIIKNAYPTLNYQVISEKPLYEVMDKMIGLKQAQFLTQDSIIQAEVLLLSQEASSFKVFGKLHLPVSFLQSLKKSRIVISNEIEEPSEKMAQLTSLLGKAMGLQASQLEKLNLLVAMHDIGKIGIDNKILMKPGKLTAEEWIEMQQHPGIGYRLALTAPDLKPIALDILCHQERWDGKGYPNGLQKEAIPLFSRILAVADAYDAMTSDRPYRKALSKEYAIAEIVKGSGTQFDPEVVKLFLEVIPNFSVSDGI